MGIDNVLTRELVFRWDETRRKVLVLDGQRAERAIAEIDYATLDKMSWPEASKFLGEFVTLLFPELRARYESEFPDMQKTDEPDRA
jgi:hypothetical protein